METFYRVESYDIEKKKSLGSYLLLQEVFESLEEEDE